ncbi:MAG: hypothetical protein FJZ96_15000 [Chloroflexi bacterium]|nr:hypothetical protein [Chloroflexota bacterium]
MVDHPHRISGLLFAWQYLVTGDATLNPYRLWWEYDRMGFGPGIGRNPGGHSLYWGFRNLKDGLALGWKEFFGWGGISGLFLPAGILSQLRNRKTWLPILVFPSLAEAYLTYWMGSAFPGPRYLYEGFASLTLLTSAGVAWLAGSNPAGRFARMRRVTTGCLLALLVGYNLTLFLPARLLAAKDMYGVSAADLEPFSNQEALALTPALVVVHHQESWTDYGALLELEDPWLTTPFIFTIYSKSNLAALEAAYADRRLYHYYPDDPGQFHLGTR